MADQFPSERLSSEVSRHAGVYAGQEITAALKPARLATFVFASMFFLLAAGWLLKPAPASKSAPGPLPRIDVPPAAVDASAMAPHATEKAPEIASIKEMAKPWSVKEFFYTNPRSGESVPGLLVRLPSGAVTQSSGYWALVMNAAYGNCQLEYISDSRRLAAEYGFRDARHPMVGNPCSRTVFDPLKISNLSGTVWARGGIVQGSDLRPPLGIEIEIHGDAILAVRME
jgi:hypothetical protein